MQGGVDLSGGGGAVDLSGGGGHVNLQTEYAPAPAPTGIATGIGTQPTTGAAPPGGYAGQAGAQMATAALQNTQVQEALKAQAYDAAQQGWEAAKVGGVAAASELGKYVQEGPAGISILCFLGGLATTLIGLIGVMNIGAIFSKPFTWLLSAYLTLFGFVAVLLEADTEKLAELKVIGKLAPLFEQYQMQIYHKAQFLTELRGRGLFYLFVGTLSITQCWVCLFFLCGLWNLLMGVLCLMMSFGINPADHLPSSNPLAQAPYGVGPQAGAQQNYGPIVGGHQ